MAEPIESDESLPHRDFGGHAGPQALQIRNAGVQGESGPALGRPREPATRLGHVRGIDAAAHKAHEWLQDLTGLGGFADAEQAYAALHAVLHALRDRITVDEAAHLAAQLPMLIRGLYFEGWRPAATPTRERRKEDFLAGIAARLRNASIDAERACRAVFRLLQLRVALGEMEDVEHMLPSEIRDLWRGPVR